MRNLVGHLAYYIELDPNETLPLPVRIIFKEGIITHHVTQKTVSDSHILNEEFFYLDSNLRKRFYLGVSIFLSKKDLISKIASDNYISI